MIGKIIEVVNDNSVEDVRSELKKVLGIEDTKSLREAYEKKPQRSLSLETAWGKLQEFDFILDLPPTEAVTFAEEAKRFFIDELNRVTRVAEGKEKPTKEDEAKINGSLLGEWAEMNRIPTLKRCVDVVEVLIKDVRTIVS